jgi:hypothetical protein
MSEGIKKMLAERAAVQKKLAADREGAAYVPKREAAWQKGVDDTFAMIKRAAPFMDEGSDPSKWRPSDRLRMVFCVCSTGENSAVMRVHAFRFVHAMLDRARRLWVNGSHPDPWAKNDKIPLDLSEAR